jgi:hypothetical protein
LMLMDAFIFFKGKTIMLNKKKLCSIIKKMLIY